MQFEANRPSPLNIGQTGQAPPFNLIPNFMPLAQSTVLPFNASYIELPGARAEDLTPRSGWISKVAVVEKKYIEQKNENIELHELVQQLRLQLSTMETTANLNLEQLSAHIVSLEHEIEAHKVREEYLKAQLKARDDYIGTVKETVKDNEERYLKHLEMIKREYEKLEESNKMLQNRIAELSSENHSIKLQALEARNELAKVHGIRDTEKTLIQNQLKETQTELAKVNNKCYELTRELDRTKYMLEDMSSKASKTERELIYKENEIKRLQDLVQAAEEKLRADDRDFDKTLNDRILTLTHEYRADKSDAETKYKLEQKTNFELSVKLDQLGRTLQSVRQENQELKSSLKMKEEMLMKAELLEKEVTQQFNSLKTKYDSHFSRRDMEGFNKEVKLVRYQEELQSLKLEKENQEKLVFQYQNFLKLYNLEYEFNSLTRLEKGNFSKPLASLKHEAREKAAREYYLQNESKKFAAEMKRKYETYEETNHDKVEELRRGMDNIADDMEEEWKKLFTNLSEFKTKVNL